MRAIVVGAGIAGAAAAVALRRAGHEATVIERAVAIAPLGAAISLWPNAVEALARLGLAEAVAARAASLAALSLYDREGRALTGPTVLRRPAYVATRAAVQEVLLGELADDPPRLGTTATAVTPDGRVTLADGRVETADLVVVADGIRSATATALAGAAPTYRGYRGTLALADGVAGAPAVDGEYWGDGERFGVFDLGEGRRYWFHMATSADPSPAPPPDSAGWPEAVRAAVVATPREAMIPVAIFARPPARRLAFGRIALAGDAGHAIEPNLGQGACLALEDAAVLGALAAQLPADAIPAAYERARLGRVRAVARAARLPTRLVHGGALAARLGAALFRAMPAPMVRHGFERFDRLPVA